MAEPERKYILIEDLPGVTLLTAEKLQELGFNTGKSETPIIPIIVGDSIKAKVFSERLFEKGIFVVPIVYPMVAPDLSRIRIQMNAKLSAEDLDTTIEKIKKTGKKLDII